MANHAAGGGGFIDVYGTDDMRHLVEVTRDEAMKRCTFFANAAPALEQRIVKQLTKEGLRGRGLLGTTEGRAAKSVTRHLLVVADHEMWIAQAIVAAGQAWFRNVAEPIQQARSSTLDADVLKI